MTMVSRQILVVMIALLLFGTTPADAAIEFTWSFDEPLPAIGGPTTVFDVPATIVVAPTSDSFQLTLAIVDANNFNPEYDFNINDLVDLIITSPHTFTAGEIFNFRFGQFSPAAPDFAAAIGDYSMGPDTILGSGNVNVESGNLFTARVVETVPEASTMLLVGSGLVGLAAWCRRRR